MLFLEIVRIARSVNELDGIFKLCVCFFCFLKFSPSHKRPKALFLENVPGLVKVADIFNVKRAFESDVFYSQVQGGDCLKQILQVTLQIRLLYHIFTPKLWIFKYISIFNLSTLTL
jgi:hypothetical protein